MTLCVDMKDFNSVVVVDGDDDDIVAAGSEQVDPQENE
jgi:hypothetical protein